MNKLFWTLKIFEIFYLLFRRFTNKAHQVNKTIKLLEDLAFILILRKLVSHPK